MFYAYIDGERRENREELARINPHLTEEQCAEIADELHKGEVILHMYYKGGITVLEEAEW